MDIEGSVVMERPRSGPFFVMFSCSISEKLDSRASASGVGEAEGSHDYNVGITVLIVRIAFHQRRHAPPPAVEGILGVHQRNPEHHGRLS
jgi:hypothetical protein